MTVLQQTALLPAELKEAAAKLLASGGRMQMAYAWYPKPRQLELRYVASVPGQVPFAVWRCEADDSVPSLANNCPLLGWYEREITDLFGLRFADHPQPQRLVLHEGVNPRLPPFDPDYPADEPLRVESNMQAVPELGGAEADVQLLPFGPVRADVMESAEFLFFYVGEAILHYQPQLFFKHRGMEKRFEGLEPGRGVVLAERVSGVGSFAHALAYCQALEAAANCEVPARAKHLRVLLAEMERLYNHLHYFGHLCDTTTLKVGHAEGILLEERAKQLNTRLTGSRFLRSLLGLGGLRRDLTPGPWLAAELGSLGDQFSAYARHMESTASHLDRLITTGKLDRRTAFDQGATGPIERASGIDRDLRRDHPYAAYGALPPAVAVREAGDAHARAQVRMDAPEQRSTRLGRNAARHPFLRRAYRRRRQAGARQDQVAVVFELARVPVHRARNQHDGLRHQRGELRSHHRGLRSLAHDPEKWEPVFGKDHAQRKGLASHAAMDIAGLAAGQTDRALAAGQGHRRARGFPRHAAIHAGVVRRML
ncbi:MAG: NADH-quinone oxidoreductase subunit C [Pseudolabrys sp.]